jgi:hypothetical protein
MLKNLDQIPECYLRAEECRRWAATASPPSIREDFLAHRWLSLARGYEFAKQQAAKQLHRTFCKQRDRDSRRLGIAQALTGGIPWTSTGM